MGSGYKLKWTDLALQELKEVFTYLEENWMEKEIKKLAKELDKTVEFISKSPEMFQFSDKKGIRRAVVLRYNNLYYRVNETTIEILSFYANRKNPKNREI